MTANPKPERTRQLRLKKSTNWFAAGEEFLMAMGILTDGAFKLFVLICLKADRHSATYRTSSDDLAHALHKPLTSIETSLAEIKAKKVCSIVAINDREYLFRIADEFWPYCTNRGYASAGQHATDYVAAVRQVFLDLGCTSGRFGTSEQAQVRSLEKRGVPLDIVRDAMIMGACRKYVSWLNDGYSEPISSISYFESVIAELLRCPPPADYREYLPYELKRLAKYWVRKAQMLTDQLHARSSDGGGYQAMGPGEIVDPGASQKPISPAD